MVVVVVGVVAADGTEVLAVGTAAAVVVVVAVVGLMLLGLPLLW